MSLPEIIREIDVSIPGEWSGTLADDTEGESEESWQTPGIIRLRAEEICKLSVHKTATDEDLASLFNLRNVETLKVLTFKECDQITDAGLAHLKNLRNLRRLDLGCKKLTNAGLAHLHGLTTLQELLLTDCEQITDKGLALLRGLIDLRLISLPKTKVVTDEGLASLFELRNLRILMLSQEIQIDNLRDVWRNPIGDTFRKLFPKKDTGLSNLCGFTNLEKLHISGCHDLTDTGLAHLRGLVNLQDLSLVGCCKITDAGLAHLQSVHGLRRLNLCVCKNITGSGLLYSISGLTELRELELWSCAKVTSAAVAQIRQRLPRCKVFHSSM